jgi:hypothetical protein
LLTCPNRRLSLLVGDATTLPGRGQARWRGSSGCHEPGRTLGVPRAGEVLVTHGHLGARPCGTSHASCHSSLGLRLFHLRGINETDGLQEVRDGSPSHADRTSPQQRTYGPVVRTLYWREGKERSLCLADSSLPSCLVAGGPTLPGVYDGTGGLGRHQLSRSGQPNEWGAPRRTCKLTLLLARSLSPL